MSWYKLIVDFFISMYEQYVGRERRLFQSHETIRDSTVFARLLLVSEGHVFRVSYP